MRVDVETPFVCQRCGNCCRGDGNVRLQQDDVVEGAAILDMSVAEFTDAYTSLSEDRRSLRLIDHPDGSCIFLNAGGNCRIHEAKPVQCRSFPMTWTYPGWENECEGQLMTREGYRAYGS